MSEEDARPRLRIINGGEPSEEELAALIAVMTLGSGAVEAEERKLREPLNAWVASGLVKGTRTKV
ncbi:MAG TPA: acyl-CoA carboxylase epsilon subunit [Mycobacteriales bacterium]|nr:acyl-CoA carboxylase epsilon subunit [Mycobacteriales bacterium]